MSTWIMRVPVLSSAHLSFRTTKDLVEGKYEDQPVAPYAEGVFLWVDYEEAPPGFPKDLKLLIEWARKHKYAWVRLDADGDVRRNLPTYKNTWS